MKVEYGWLLLWCIYVFKNENLWSWFVLLSFKLWYVFFYFCSFCVCYGDVVLFVLDWCEFVIVMWLVMVLVVYWSVVRLYWILLVVWLVLKICWRGFSFYVILDVVKELERKLVGVFFWLWRIVGIGVGRI